ncbi:16S rRNA (guanine(527)-N(7))-methyltransferase RsmG [Desulfobotulus sp. H1]|uniref:Ribosomal RNA small subunit methyltransferase G n=1 Tax=Desulfobotulus pelophilus TaxID=2823377 RepID=A0ABT3N5Z6_9BACT|nr:16S rRNA (guanine(527)-N(7))-methyltransferase RsmG [Desulfobotulus pelophilus]MCW7752885.1 16S rRNA (guanine(527)-N(7))-methyltransferase RsmG [Desulfobotulus pelophilus]
MAMQVGDDAWCDVVKTGAVKMLGAALDERVVKGLAFHANSLMLWNGKVNLTSITDPLQVAEKHVLDALAVTPFLPKAGRVLDVGTGGGFPGIAMALMRPDLDVVMVDSVHKKTVFVREVIRGLRLERAQALHARVESLQKNDGCQGFSCIVSRAFTALGRFVEMGLPLLHPSGTILAMKGPEGTTESLPSCEGLEKDVFCYDLPFGGGERVIVRLRRSPYPV